MHHDKYWRSKIPVGLVLLFAANIILVIMLDILLFYPLPADLTETDFAKSDARFQSCTIVSMDDTNSLTVYLVETDDGQQHIIPARQHGLAYGRSRLYKKQIKQIPEGDGSHTVNIKIGIHNIPVTVARESWQTSAEEHTQIATVSIDGMISSSYRTTTTLYMVIAAVLEFLELALWQLLKGHS